MELASVATTVIRLVPAFKVNDVLQLVVPLATAPLTVTFWIPLASDAVPLTVIPATVNTWPLAGWLIVNEGAVVSGGVYVTMSVSVLVLPAASLAVTVMTLDPAARLMLGTDQLAVPLAVPLPPAELDQLTKVTPTLSLAVPPRLIVLEDVDHVDAEVGLVITTVGAVVSGGL